MQLITGNTYPVKDQIKALGGKWNGTRKGWEVPDDVADQARALLDGAPGRRSSYPRNRSRYGNYYTPFQTRRGRCEDAPCCGCCS